MSQVTAAEVKSLRDRTGQPMMECKKALVETAGDMEKAVELLRSRGKGVADKRLGKEAAEGCIAACIDGEQAAIVEVRCESAPVAKTEQFIEMCADIANHCAQFAAGSIEELLKQPFLGDAKKTVQDRIDDVVSLIREKMEIARFTRLTGGQFGSYRHHDGTVGVLLQVEGKDADPQLLRDVCMHIAAIGPVAGTRDDVPDEVLAKEKEIAIAQTREDPKMEGKPDQIIEKASQGKLNKWLAQNVLADQPFVKDESKKVGELFNSAGVKLKSFVRYRVGEAYLEFML